MNVKLPILLIITGILLITSTVTHNRLQSNPGLSNTDRITSAQDPESTIPNQEILGEKNLETATISAVVDGDTVKLSDGRTLRYIGVDTPETVDPRREVGCFGREASEYNRLLTLNKTVYLEKDISDTDRYGRLLRYVYLQSGEMVNEMLVREGYAYSSAYPPDVKYQERLNSLEKQARDTNAGLWNACAEHISPTPNIGSFSCDCNKTCSTITTCAEATFQLKQCSCSNLDGNNDGIACNSLCR